jgi:hypothetical protein
MYTPKMKLLTLRPSVKTTASSIIIQPAPLIRLLTLFTFNHRVEIFPSKKYLSIGTRRLFFSDTKHLSFSNLWYIDYGYDSTGTSWGRSGRGYGRQDEIETFTLSVVTRNEETYKICSFKGEGAVATGWGGVFWGGDSMVDYMGTQEEESLDFVNSISKLLDIPIGKPLEDMVDMATCPSCNRSTSLQVKKCLYCGAVVNPDAKR